MHASLRLKLHLASLSQHLCLYQFGIFQPVTLWINVDTWRFKTIFWEIKYNHRACCYWEQRLFVKYCYSVIKGVASSLSRTEVVDVCMENSVLSKCTGRYLESFWETDLRSFCPRGAYSVQVHIEYRKQTEWFVSLERLHSLTAAAKI